MTDSQTERLIECLGGISDMLSSLGSGNKYHPGAVEFLGMKLEEAAQQLAGQLESLTEAISANTRALENG